MNDYEFDLMREIKTGEFDHEQGWENVLWGTIVIGIIYRRKPGLYGKDCTAVIFVMLHCIEAVVYVMFVQENDKCTDTDTISTCPIFGLLNVPHRYIRDLYTRASSWCPELAKICVKLHLLTQQIPNQRRELSWLIESKCRYISIWCWSTT
jgi:hypothetical protein